MHRGDGTHNGDEAGKYHRPRPVAIEECGGSDHVLRTEQSRVRSIEHLRTRLAADPVAHHVAGDRRDRRDHEEDPQRRGDRSCREEQAGAEEQRVARQEESEQDAAFREDDQRKADQPVVRQQMAGIERARGKHGTCGGVHEAAVYGARSASTARCCGGSQEMSPKASGPGGQPYVRCAILGVMPIATPEQYADMLDRAKRGGFAYPAINVTSSETLNAALQWICRRRQRRHRSGVHWRCRVRRLGTKVKDMVTGAVALAEYAHVVAQKYPIHIALHTDHCQKEKLDSLRPPADGAVARAGRPWRESAVPVAYVGRLGHRAGGEPADRRRSCWQKASKAHIVLEVEIGVVGGEEDGVVGEIEREAVHHAGRRAANGRNARHGREGPLPACRRRFGNVHGVYKPGNVKLRPDILKEIQDAVGEKVGRRQAVRVGLPRRIRLGCSRRSGRPSAYGVVKMNVDTDTQYAFTRPIAGHMFTNYDGVLKVDGDVGNKKAYDPRSYLQDGRSRYGRPSRNGV